MTTIEKLRTTKMPKGFEFNQPLCQMLESLAIQIEDIHDREPKATIAFTGEQANSYVNLYRSLCDLFEHQSEAQARADARIVTLKDGFRTFAKMSVLAFICWKIIAWAKGYDPDKDLI